MTEADESTMLQVSIDPTLRVGVNEQLTFAPFMDVEGEEVPEVGTAVLVLDKTNGAVAPGIVVAVNDVAMLVYLAVAWQDFVSMEEAFG